MTKSIPATTSIGNVKLLRRCGRVLIAAFVLAVITNLFPLNFRSPVWGLSLSSNIVASVSLALVGVGLLRWSAFLEIQALAGAEASRPPLGDASRKLGRSKESSKLNKTEQGIRRFAMAGAISLLLLAAWQIVLFYLSMDLIASQSLSASRRSQSQMAEVEQRIQNAPAPILDAEWSQIRSNAMAPSLTSNLDATAKRTQLLKQVRLQTEMARLAFEKRIAGTRWNLGRDTARVLLMACIYAWGFYGLHKL